MNKYCPMCKTMKTTDDFTENKARKDGLKFECIECSRRRSKKYHSQNKEHVQEYEKKRNVLFKEQHGGLGRCAVLRLEVISAYGGRCSCCGEDKLEFLALDHVNGGGAKHIKENDSQVHYRDAKKRNYPPDYRVLCHNCNLSIGHYGYCPHQRQQNKPRWKPHYTQAEILDGTWRNE